MSKPKLSVMSYVLNSMKYSKEDKFVFHAFFHLFIDFWVWLELKINFVINFTVLLCSGINYQLQATFWCWYNYYIIVLQMLSCIHIVCTLHFMLELGVFVIIDGLLLQLAMHIWKFHVIQYYCAISFSWILPAWQLCDSVTH